MVLTEEELKEEQTLLREKLKAVNKNLDRIVNKELVIQQAIEGKERQNLKMQAEHTAEEIAHEVEVIDKHISNTKHRKKILKEEYHELQGKMTKHLSDPEACDKLKMQLTYLDDMIKGEYIQIKNLNEQINQFIRYDFVQKEVDGERRLVQFEDELMRIRIKDETIKLVNVRNEKQKQEYVEKIVKATEEQKKLKQELD